MRSLEFKMDSYKKLQEKIKDAEDLIKRFDSCVVLLSKDFPATSQSVNEQIKRYIEKYGK